MQVPNKFPPEHRGRTGERRARFGGRSERVVHDVLRAAASELARTGYAALRIEDVAARAGVNKTTVYRRWPTKADLISAMVRALGQAEPEAPSTGVLRTDLLALLRTTVARLSTPEGQGCARVLLSELDQPEVAALVHGLRRQHHAPWFRIIEGAIERGELPAGSDPQLLIDLLHSTVLGKVLRLREVVDEAFLTALVDLVLVGARGGGAVRKK